jgi:hypothetical protein
MLGGCADNTKIFRDIKEVASRRVLDETTPGLKIVEVLVPPVGIIL